MRIPKVESRNLNLEEKERNVNINFYINPKMEVMDWETDEKICKKFIKKIERIVRNSSEYKTYIKFLKEEINMNNCAFFKCLNRNELYGISIEIHHAPFTLYDITFIILSYMKKNNERINERTVAKEVLKAHYKGMIGLIPLCVTAHELVHDGDIFIPVDKVYGNVQKFVDYYNDGLQQEHRELLNKAIEETEKLYKYSPAILEKKITYLTVNGMEFPKKLKDDTNKVS